MDSSQMQQEIEYNGHPQYLWPAEVVEQEPHIPGNESGILAVMIVGIPVARRMFMMLAVLGNQQSIREERIEQDSQSAHHIVESFILPVNTSVHSIMSGDEQSGIEKSLQK